MTQSTSAARSADGRQAEALTPREVAARADLSARSARAVAAYPDLQRHTRGWWLDGTTLQARAPHVHPDLGTADWACVRGATDAVALLTRYSSRAMREATSPADDLFAELVFALLERLRVETLGRRHHTVGWPGLVRNLEHRFDTWTHEALGAGDAGGARAAGRLRRRPVRARGGGAAARAA